MRSFKRLVQLLLGPVLILTFSTTSFAEGKAETTQRQNDARAIMKKVYARQDGESQVTLQKLSTCRYTRKDKRLICAETPRKKIFESVRKDYGINEKDKRSISVLLDPPAEKGVGFLQYDYESNERTADQWISLPAMGKVKRIVSGNEQQPKQGSFFGSEFSYEDMETPRQEDYTYSLLKTENYKERLCWIIEIVPTPEKAKRSNYSKSISWIDQETLITLKTITYNWQGKKSRRITAKNIQQVDGIWMPMSLSINNLETRRMSSIKFQAVTYNIPVDDDFLTLRTLTDGAFRAAKLKTFRTYLK